MPYRTISELPDGVRTHLPPRAQEIYLVAYNSAWSEYGPDDLQAQRAAWAAVEREYRRDVRGQWVPREER